MRTDQFDYDDKRYSEQEIQAIRISRNPHLYPKSLQNFDRNRAKALAQNTQPTNSLLDDDVLSWLTRQNVETKRHINEMLRQAMQMQQAMI